MIQDYPVAVRPPLEHGAALAELFREAGRDPVNTGARRCGDSFERR
jgi:hypothetical protein